MCLLITNSFNYRHLFSIFLEKIEVNYRNGSYYKNPLFGLNRLKSRLDGIDIHGNKLMLVGRKELL